MELPMSAYEDALKKVTATIQEAEKDAKSLSEFVYKPIGFMVNRRLAPQIHTLDYYIQYLESFKSVMTSDIGFVQVGNKTVPTMGQALSDAVVSAGYEIVGSFASGATLTKRNQVLQYGQNGMLYRWGGELPKTVSANSTPESTGGYGSKSWLEVSDAALRQELSGSIASGKGAALVNGSTLNIKSVSELKSLQPKAGQTVIVTGTYGGVFEYNSSSHTAQVSGDIGGDFYIAPNSNSNGSGGAWVRVSGTPATNYFANPAPANARIFSLVDSKEYVYKDGSWEYVNKTLDVKIDNHIQDSNPHGLNGFSVAIGRDCVATGTNSLAIGYKTTARDGYAIGRENRIDGSAFSMAFGRGNTVSCTSDLRQNATVGNYNSVSEASQSTLVGRNNIFTGGINNVAVGDSLKVTNSSDVAVFGRKFDVTNCLSTYGIGNDVFLSNTSDTYLFGKSSTSAYATKFCSESVVLGSKCYIAGSTGSVIDKAAVLGSNSYISGSGSKSIVIGNNSNSKYANSFVIGNDIAATANNQIVIGNSTNNTVIAGSLNVSGTKNFKIPHPVPSKKATHFLVHSSYEGDCEGGTIYRHRVVTKDGSATKELPEWFKYLNKDVVVYVTPHKHFGAAYGDVIGNTLTVASNVDGDYNVLIMGTRNDDAVQAWQGVEVLK